jgi:transglutaminase-like putative cysteine protease
MLAVSIIATVYTSVWEYSVRRYLKGFSDAIVPQAADSQLKAEAILAWMRVGPPRLEVQRLSDASPRDPHDTLNYRQLLEVCGSATNAFLNLSRSTGLQARRLLLLAPDRTAKHVVAEVWIDGRWVIADPTFRTFLKDSHGRLLTRKDLQNPEILREATGSIPNYLPAYSYERLASVRAAAIPYVGAAVRHLLDGTVPAWDDSLDWSLLLERRSFMYFFLAVNALIALLLMRIVIAWLADHRFQVPRFHLRANLSRATAAFFTTPEIK